jgi:uncharacterized protein YcbX
MHFPSFEAECWIARPDPEAMNGDIPHPGALRLRPNIVVGGVDGLAEREWPGACLRIGKALIGVQDLRSRCIMTAYDPDTQVRDKGITQDIYRRFDGTLALNCFVIEGGDISVGDAAELVRGRGCGESAAAPA